MSNQAKPARAGRERAMRGTAEPTTTPTQAPPDGGGPACPVDFDALYVRNVDPMYRFCLRRIGNVQAAEDATAQVFTQALAALPGFRDGSERAWLFTIAARVVIDMGRAERPQAELTAAAAVTDPALGPEEAVLQAESARTVRALLAELTPDQRHAMELRLAGLTGVEIAHVLGRSHGTVRNLQHRALERLRTVLGLKAQAGGATDGLR